MRITATSAPTKDDVNAAVSASSALPCWAMGWPSSVVATDHGSPGMLKRIDVMAPPNRAPQYRLVSRMIAEVGGIVKVRGSRIATPLAPPRPGRTPMMVPRMIPTTAIMRLNGVMAIWKPIRRCSRPAMVPPSVSEQRLEGSLGHRHQEPQLEDEEGDQGNSHAHQDDERPRVPADPPHVDREVDGAGDVQAH